MLDQTWAFATGPVNGVGPSGTLNAGSLEIKRSFETDALKYHFKGARESVIHARKIGALRENSMVFYRDVFGDQRDLLG